MVTDTAIGSTPICFAKFEFGNISRTRDYRAITLLSLYSIINVVKLILPKKDMSVLVVNQRNLMIPLKHIQSVLFSPLNKLQGE